MTCRVSKIFAGAVREPPLLLIADRSLLFIGKKQLMTTPYNYIKNLNDPANLPAKGILSQTIHDDDRVRVVLFGFAAGEELSEHTSTMAAVMHVLQGEARIIVGGDDFDAKPGAWVHMAPRLPHSLRANTPVIMLLVMLKGES